MKNPYWNRNMIREPKYFFGRKKEIERIFAAIETPHPQPISIAGERKIGKSSLLYYILQSSIEKKKLAHPEKYVFAFLDFQQCLRITLKEFWEKLYVELKDKLPSELEIMQVEDYDTFTNMVKALDDHDYKLILLFDEFDKILQNENFGEDFFSYLRSLTNRYDVAYILSTQRKLEGLPRKDIFGSPFFNIFTPIRLGLFQKDEVLDLINNLSSEESVFLDEESGFILKNAGLFPFFIQLLCFKLFEYKKKHDKKIGQEGYMQVLEEFREEATPHYKYFWRSFSQEEKKVLIKIARGKKVKNEKKSVVTNLKQKGYVTPVNGKNQVFSDTFKQFILDHQEAAEVGKRKTMKQKLYKIISGYSHIMKGILSLLSIILLSILSNWVYERYFSGEDSPFIKAIGNILSIFSPISSLEFFFILSFLLIVNVILFLSFGKITRKSVREEDL